MYSTRPRGDAPEQQQRKIQPLTAGLAFVCRALMLRRSYRCLPAWNISVYITRPHDKANTKGHFSTKSADYDPCAIENAVSKARLGNRSGFFIRLSDPHLHRIRFGKPRAVQHSLSRSPGSKIASCSSLLSGLRYRYGIVCHPNLTSPAKHKPCMLTRTRCRNRCAHRRILHV